MAESGKFVRGTWVPTTFVEPLGHLTVWFGLLEQNVNETIWTFMDLEEGRGKAVTAQINSFVTKLTMLELLAEKQIADEKWKIAFADVLSKARTANTLRNNIIHGDWSYATEVVEEVDGSASIYVNSKKVHKNSMTRNGKERSIPITIKIITEAAESAFDAAIRLEIARQTASRIKPEGWPPR